MALCAMVIAGSVLWACQDKGKQQQPLAADELDKEGGQSRARIVFSYPQVFSRESLINDRLKEGAFLDEMITESSKAQFQSQLRRDLSTISSMTAQLGVTFNPAAKLDFDRSKPLDDIKQEIELTKLRAELQRVQQQFESLQRGAGPGPAGPSSTTPGTATSQTVDQSATKAQLETLLAKTKETLDQLAKMASTGPRQAGETQSPEDRFKDLQVYRAQLRSALNTQKLDDVHDRDGNALYRMQFIATLFPGPDSSRKQWGIASIEVESPKLKDGDVARLYLRWLRHTTERYNQVGSDGEMSQDTLYESMINDNKLLGLVALSKQVVSGTIGDRLWIAVNPDLVHPIKGLIQSEAALNEMADTLKNFTIAYPKVDDVKSGRRKARTGSVSKKLEADLEAMRAELAKNIETSSTTCPFPNMKGNGRWGRFNEVFQRADVIAQANPFLQAGLQGINAVQRERARIRGRKPKDIGYNLLANVASDTADVLWLIKRLYGMVDGACKGELANLVQSETYVSVPAHFRNTVIKHDEHSCEDVAAYSAKIAEGKRAVQETEPDPTKKYDACGRPVVYSVTPTEQAQRVSTLASAANSVQMALALSAGLPGYGAGGQAGVSDLRSAAGTADALERLPLVVAFSEPRYSASAKSAPGKTAAPSTANAAPGKTESTPDRSPDKSDRFGWVFGPQSYITSGKETKVGLRHSVSVHQVAVEVSVPVWWPTFTLNIQTAWIRNVWTDGLLDISEPKRHNQRMEVNRPLSIGDLDSLTAYLLRAFPPFAIRAVRIDRIEPEHVLLCQDNAEVTLLIYGLNLWRNPQAYMFGRKASNIRVLPDMQGIAADFVLSEKRYGAEDWHRLVVWTQSGPAEAWVKLQTGKDCLRRTAGPISKGKARASGEKRGK